MVTSSVPKNIDIISASSVLLCVPFMSVLFFFEVMSSFGDKSLYFLILL